jgi:hypothetical protein
MIERTLAQGRCVLFFGVLERDRTRWEWTIHRFNRALAYDDFSEWRQSSRTVWRGADYGFAGDLYELQRPTQQSP